MGTMASQFGLDREQQLAFSGTGRSYFITRLFRDVLFKEAGLAGTNLRFERRLAWLRRGAYAGTLTLVALVLGGWAVSYIHNRAYVTEAMEEAQAAREQLQGVSQNETDLLAAVPALNTLRELPGGYADQDGGTPWLMGLGLSQEEKLGPQAERAYLRALKQAFLPRLLFRLEEQLKENWDNTEFLYEGLKVYLMLGTTEHFDPATIRAWMAFDWEQNLPRSVSSEQRQQLQGHLDALLTQGPIEPPLPPDKGLIRQARAKLKQVPLAERIYARLKGTPEFDTLPAFRVSEAVGPQASRVFTRASGKPLSEGVEGLYTYRGYRIFLAKSEVVVDRLLEESWVLGEGTEITKAPDEARQHLAQRLRELYLEDYRQHWEALLGDLEITPLSEFEQAVELVNALAGPDSPMQQLLKAVTRETNLQRQPQEQAEDKAQKAGRADKERLAQLVGGVSASSQPAEKDPVTEHFSALHRQVQGGDNGSAPIKSTLALLDKLYMHLDSIASAEDRGSRAYKAVSDRGGTILERVEREARHQPQPLRRWLRALAQESSNLITGSARRYLNAMWSSKVRSFYDQALAGRFPLDLDSPRGVTLEDFGRFFGPGGIEEQFFKQHLQPFVDTSSSGWRWRAKGENKLGLSDTTLYALQQAEAIRQAFFHAGSQQPKARFELKPVVMDAAVHQFTLDLHGQIVTYSHGPIRPTLLKWPGSGDTRQVRITWRPPTADGRSGITKNGPWAWFRLLEEAHVESAGNPESLEVTFGPPEREATFELHATSTHNPFQLEALERFHCPERL